MGSARWLTNSKYSNIVHAKSLTLTGHGLAVRVLLPSLQRALEAKRQNITLKFHIYCAIVEIQQAQSYHKWLESRLQLLLKVEKRYCGIRKGLTKLIIFYHATCIYFSGLSLQGIDRIWWKSSVFYLTSRLTRGGYLLVNYQKSIILCGDPTLSCLQLAKCELQLAVWTQLACFFSPWHYPIT